MNVCTIIAKNYLAYARVLARSLHAHHPDARFSTLIIDDFAGYVDPAEEPFEILTPAEVGCDQFTQMALRYSVLELSTAVKPWLLRHLMGETGGPVTYLDPDIKVFGSLQRLDDLAERHGLVLIPHNSRPIPQDGRRPSQVDIMIAGVYNLGYVTLAPRPEVEILLDWWADRLLRDCRVDPVWGYFVDQRWFDLAPGLVSDLAIVRDPEYNVAYWNLHSLELTRRGEQFLVDGHPLAFFHYSGFDPDHPLILSKHQDRIDVLANPALEALLADYAADVIREGHSTSRHWPYTYGALGDGTHLDESLRVLYDRFSEEEETRGRAAPSPFDLDGIRAFDEWLMGPAPGAIPGITRALAYVHQDRVDLRRAYPDLGGPGGAELLSWAETYGRQESPLLARTMSAERRALGRISERAQEVGRGSDGLAAPSEGIHDGPRGVNVIGHFGTRGESGDAARSLVSALDAREIPVAPIQTGPVAVRGGDPYLTVALEDAPFPVNVLCFGGDVVPEFVRQAGRQAVAGRYSVGLWIAHASRVPESWSRSLSLLEEIWVPSAYAARAVESVATVPVTIIRLPVRPIPHGDVEVDLGLPKMRFMLLCVDYSSGFHRQNPLGAIEAFRAAVTPADQVGLVIRARHPERDRDAHARLLEAAAAPNITVIDREMMLAEEHALLARCECFISLHRADSVGMAMAEAMWCGKPVIATGYSGNLDFMTTSNSLLVEHAVVPVASGIDGLPVGAGVGRYPPDAQWAEPDVDHASTLIRGVLDDPGAARERGWRAAADIYRTHSPAAAGEIVARRLEAIRATGRVRIAADDSLDLSAVIASLPLRVQAAWHRPAAPGRWQRLRQSARRWVLRIARPVTASQQAVNDAFITALMELNRAIAAQRRADARKRAELLAQVRRYEQETATSANPSYVSEPFPRSGARPRAGSSSMRRATS